MSRNYPKYHRIALKAYGPLPVVCRCGELVRKLSDNDGVVHHKDENVDNNDPSNLEIMHHGCHSSYHHTGRQPSAETRAKMSMSATGRPMSPEARAKMSVSRTGHSVSEETRRKIGDANRGRKMSDEQRALLSEQRRGKIHGSAAIIVECECGKRTTQLAMGMHTKHSGHKLAG